MTTSTNDYDAIVVMAALVKSNGRYIDDHTDQPATLEHAAVFHRPSKEDVVVPILTGVYFCLNGMYANLTDGKVHLSRESVGGVVFGNKYSVVDSIYKFNEENPSSLTTLTEFNVVDKPPISERKAPSEVVQDFYPYVKEEHHDDAGTIFHRHSFFNTIFGHADVSWTIARARELTADDVYVRIYSPSGEISHYVHLPVMQTMIKYHDFCRANGIVSSTIRNLVYIKEAIQEFHSDRK